MPDPNHETVTIGTSFGPSGNGCQEATYTDCFYNRQDFLIGDRMNIDDEQFMQLMFAVYYDIGNRPNSAKDRTRYDTPFWDGGKHPGQVCFGNGSCYMNHEVNYLAQGMWSAEKGQSLNTGLKVVQEWKSANHILFPNTYPSSKPSEGTIHWFIIGYYFARALMYQNQ